MNTFHEVRKDKSSRSVNVSNKWKNKADYKQLPGNIRTKYPRSI